jgi:hypothetical protein
MQPHAAAEKVARSRAALGAGLGLELALEGGELLLDALQLLLLVVQHVPQLLGVVDFLPGSCGNGSYTVLTEQAERGKPRPPSARG